MDRLSSCYFCGTALDEPLQDYPLVAGDTGEHGAVVTLCTGCHHKLETVLDVVVGEDEALPALEDGDRAALEGESPAALTEPEPGSAPAPIALGDGEQGDSEGSSGVGGAEGVSGAGGASGEAEDAPAGDRDAPAEAAAGGGEDRPTGSDVESPEGDSGGAETDAKTEASEESSGVTAESSPDTAPGAEAARGGDSEAGSPADGADSVSAGSGTVDGGTAGAGTTGDTADESGGGTDPDRDVTAEVSALEYNKVMRLLQNREFPVDRAEIQTVAASAYELSERECAAVIDLAVDRGLVVERDGQLVRPDG